jgi:hypothetical protein
MGHQPYQLPCFHSPSSSGSSTSYSFPRACHCISRTRQSHSPYPAPDCCSYHRCTQHTSCLFSPPLLVHILRSMKRNPHFHAEPKDNVPYVPSPATFSDPNELYLKHAPVQSGLYDPSGLPLHSPLPPYYILEYEVSVCLTHSSYIGVSYEFDALPVCDAR